jgi:hypothetical protein
MAALLIGDLHGGNVVVRSGQAILIDLASVAERGPLTTDVAALEVWLAFELPPEEDARAYKNKAWTDEIDRLYAPPRLSTRRDQALRTLPIAGWLLQSASLGK